MRRLAGRASWWALGGGLAQIATLASVALVAHVVGKETFGTYRQLLLLHGIVTILFIYSLGSSILHFAGTDDDVETARGVFGLQLMLGAIASLSLLVLAPVTSRLFSNPELLWAQVAFSPYALVVALTVSVPVMLHAVGHRVAASVALVAQPLWIAIGLATAAMLSGSAVWLAVGLVGGAVVGMVSVYTIAWRSAGRSVLPMPPRSVRTLLAYSLPLGVAAGINLLGYQTDQIVVAVLGSTAVYAVYAAGAIEVPIARLVRDALTVSAIPSLASALRESDTSRFLRIWGETIRVAALVLIPFAITMWLAAPAIISLLYGSGYEDAALYFRLYLLAIPLRLFWHDGVLIATGQTRPAMRITAVFAIVNITLNLIGWFTVGIAALPLATVIAVGVSAAMFLRVGAQQLGITLWQLIPVRSVVPGALISVAVAAAVMITGVTNLESPLLAITATGLVAGGVWIIAAGTYMRQSRGDPRALDES